MVAKLSLAINENIKLLFQLRGAICQQCKRSCASKLLISQFEESAHELFES